VKNNFQKSKKKKKFKRIWVYNSTEKSPKFCFTADDVKQYFLYWSKMILTIKKYPKKELPVDSNQNKDFLNASHIFNYIIK
jgi:hypothetical protein